MATTNLFYLLVDWSDAATAYRRHGGWGFFWEARDDQGELFAGVLPFLSLFHAPLNISFLESARDASDFYDAMRDFLDSAAQAVCDKFFGSSFWNGQDGERDGAAQDLLTETGIKPDEPAWFAMNPTTVVNHLKLLPQLPFDQLAQACTRAQMPSWLKYVQDFDDFEGYVLTFRVLLEAAASRNAGIIALF